MIGIAILGSTGSIGKQTLDVVSRKRDHVKVIGLATHQNVDLLNEQVREFNPRYVGVVSGDGGAGAEILRGPESLVQIATVPEVDLVVVATVGAAGLAATLAALDAGKRVALANKEALVMAGSLIRGRLRQGGDLVPIDSEHSAIWQCLNGEPHDTIQRITLTASGGAFRDLPLEALESVTPEAATTHPNWSMGTKVTVDSATLMNKGLEVIEATILFDVTMEQVDVVMHRESIVHSFVQFQDSSVKAQLGLPDMRLPIQYALSSPERWSNDFPRLDLSQMGALRFEPVKWERYPCLGLALEAGRMGGTYPAALCAADEVAVEFFRKGAIRFTQISRVVDDVLQSHRNCGSEELGDILQADADARQTARRSALALQA